MFAKFAPAFDAVWVSILQKDPAAFVVLRSDAGQGGRIVDRWAHAAARHWCSSVLGNSTPLSTTPASILQHPVANVTFAAQRVTGNCHTDAVAAVRSRAVLVGNMKHSQFSRLLTSLDVVVDTWPFGSGLLSHEALVLCGTPVVCLPSNIRSGRLTLAMLRRLGLASEVGGLCDRLGTCVACGCQTGLTGCTLGRHMACLSPQPHRLVATSREDLVERAVKVATNREHWRGVVKHALREKVREGKILEDPRTILAWKDFLQLARRLGTSQWFQQRSVPSVA